jgi:hypothetical protein
VTSLPVAVQRLVSADPRDPGCGETTELLHVYADLVSADPRAAVQDYPGATAHLRDCAPCAEDLTGLLAAISADAPGASAPAERRRAAGAPRLCAAPGPGHHP